MAHKYLQINQNDFPHTQLQNQNRRVCNEQARIVLGVTVVTEKCHGLFSCHAWPLVITAQKWENEMVFRADLRQSLCGKNTETFLSRESIAKAAMLCYSQWKAFHNLNSIQRNEIYGHFDGLHEHERWRWGERIYYSTD